MTPPRGSTVDRRAVLTGLAASAGSLGIAGCTDASDDSDEPESPVDSSDGDGSDSSNGDESSTAVHPEYDSTTVRVTTPDGDELGEVTAAIADTPDLQYLGLSDTETLPEDRGMLFVYETVEARTFVMREMSFGIDIVFADNEGVITAIHHASEPGPDEEGADQTYSGRGQYVLEVAYEWTETRGVEAGDRLQFDL